MGAGAIPDSAEELRANKSKSQNVWKSDAQADKTGEMLL